MPSFKGPCSRLIHRRPSLIVPQKYPGGHLTIYYGSQTGTAQMFAKQIASESESRGFLARVVDLQDVVENDDDGCIDAMRVEWEERAAAGEGEAGAEESGDEGTIDDDAAVIRATLAHPRYRDPSDGGGGADKRSRAIFLMATYGEGEPTDNSQQFVEMMKSKSGISNIYKIDPSSSSNGLGSLSGSGISLSDMGTDHSGGNNVDSSSGGGRHPTFLRDVEYAVFGLGNKQYEHYNNMSRFMDAALERCGATRVVPLGLGDDDDDLEGDFENWKDSVLWPGLVGRYVKDKSVGGEAAKKASGAGKGDDVALPPCPYVAEYLEGGAGAAPSADPSRVQTSSKHYVQALDCPVVARRELRDPSDPGSTVHLEIDISSHRESGAMSYVTADNLGILPRNGTGVVEAVGNALGYDLDRLFTLLPNGGGEEASSAKNTLPFPTPCTVRECLERYCDLTGPPRRSDLKQLAPYARSDIDRKALLRMSSKEGKAEYREKIVDRHVGIADIVSRLCPSIECPLEHFVTVCPRLQPRYYTISSSSTVHPSTIHITLAVLESEKTEEAGGGVFRGLCSGYLADLAIGDSVRAFVRESTFRLPKQVERPILMFGPGTGIAPMRALLQERSYGRSALGDEKKDDQGANVLYFGCKDRSMDYIYREELEAFADEGTLTELHLAFSREQNEKVYVQHLLAKRAEETWKLIHDQKASIFVCGAVKSE